MLRERWLGGRRAAGFTLQWHLTNACGQRCGHCYDRSDRPPLATAAGREVLDDLHAFAGRRGVRGHVTFTGGDPLLHPGFWELYAHATRRQLRAAVLGNPASPGVLDRLVAIQDPLFYQVSLEGLERTNDAVRGEGHFARTLEFLAAARARHVTTHVMLTLTRENVGEVLPLADRLRGLTARVSFNRIARVGSGEALAHPLPGALDAFLDRWVAAARRDPLLGWKDNLLGPARRRAGLGPGGGCTGHGCGAAFNFVALLPDGEVHACRKFPSPIGRLPGDGLEAAWRSDAARRYREGSAGCRGCAIRTSCGGCLAVAHGEGLDPLTARDPHCAGPLLRGRRGAAAARAPAAPRGS
jgi:selenobiotic family peptide radical SAM maturase